MLPTSSCSSIQGPASGMENGPAAALGLGHELRTQSRPPRPGHRRRDQAGGRATSPWGSGGQGCALLPNPPPHFCLQPLGKRNTLKGKLGPDWAKPGEGAGPGGQRFPGGAGAPSNRRENRGSGARLRHQVAERGYYRPQPGLNVNQRGEEGNSQKAHPVQRSLVNVGARGQPISQSVKDTT